IDIIPAPPPAPRAGRAGTAPRSPGLRSTPPAFRSTRGYILPPAPRAESAAPQGQRPMIERLIEYSIRNRFLVLLVAAALAVGGVYAVLNTPVDAIPDLSENQVIVFTDWMGRSPKEVQDQVTYPLSLKLQGLAGVKTIRSSSEFNFSMITIIFEENVDLYFA